MSETFVVPPLPGEALHLVKTIAADHGMPVDGIYKYIRQGRIDAVRIGFNVLIVDSERQRLLKEGLPSRNPGLSARWRQYRRQRREEGAVSDRGLPIDATA